MFDILQTIQPILAGVLLVLAEAFAGWCLWMSVRSDIGFHTFGPVSGGEIALTRRSHSADVKPSRSQASHVPATSA